MTRVTYIVLHELSKFEKSQPTANPCYSFIMFFDSILSVISILLNFDKLSQAK